VAKLAFCRVLHDIHRSEPHRSVGTLPAALHRSQPICLGDTFATDAGDAGFTGKPYDG
jgi:hypothetical protein